MTKHLTGGFTMPGEAGYDELTLKLAKQWGADVIRDSDGTKLSPELLNSGYDIYSTICIIRGHNDWANAHPDQLQQTFLISDAVMASGDKVVIELMKMYYSEQFRLDDSQASIDYWQVFDRTTGRELKRDEWSYRDGKVIIPSPIKWHRYTVNFLVYRIWEEISMYNHVTNNWDKEHLMPVDPFHHETAEYLKKWLTDWCKDHPETTFVRFTSMFYNFVWIWGSDARNRNRFTDWASYDFTVSKSALQKFKQTYGYRITSEDFINKGHLHSTHVPADSTKRDWMTFINTFVVSFGKELIDIVHAFGKKALLFYDDSWVGTEPYKDSFKTMGLDGIIKCVFSAFEVRLCSGVKTDIHEIRLHPYLFPTGVDGSPSFLPGGTPEKEARTYWMNVRRGLLRAPIDRIGLGGYLHLVESKPEFVSYITHLSDEFRRIRLLHAKGSPMVYRSKVAVLHFWGKLRSWTLSGHFHETYMHELIHVNECLAGLPFDVDFIDFDDIRNGAASNYSCIINAGQAGTAWSGGDEWKDSTVIEKLTEFVHNGGTFIGIREPSAVDGLDTAFSMAHVLGVDADTVSQFCHGHLSYTADTALAGELIPAGCEIEQKTEVFLTDGSTKVLQESNSTPTVTVHQFHKGYGVYLSSFSRSAENARLLQNLILYTCGEKTVQTYMADKPCIDTAYFPDAKTLVLANSSSKDTETSVKLEHGVNTYTVPAHETVFIDNI